MLASGNSGITDSIRAIWSTALGGKNICATTDFFESGGDSIAALNMIFETSAVIGHDISPVLLFEQSTFEAFVQTIEKMASEK